MLPTILSRLQVIRFNLVVKGEIKKYILNSLNLTNNDAERISEIAMGRPGKALSLASSKKELEDFDKTIKELEAVSNSTICSRFQYVKNLPENSEELKNILEIWTYYYRNIFLKQPTKKTKDIINFIETIKNLIFSTNVNSRLALERLVMEF